MSLAAKKCVPCEEGAPPLADAEAERLRAELGEGWQIASGKKLKKEFRFDDFRASIRFVNKVAALAEEEDHHPDIYILYNRVGIELWTHAVGGLSENDFILAAKIDGLA